MAYTCPHCGFVGEPVNHNRRGWRCVGCWTPLSPEAVAELASPELASGAPIVAAGDAAAGETPPESAAQPAPKSKSRGKLK